MFSCSVKSSRCSQKHVSYLTRPTDSGKQHDAYAAWRLPAFRRYFAGNMILILGWQMQKVAIGWEIYERTHSAIYLGYAGLAQFLPQVLFMLFAGHIVDTYNRKRVFMMAIACNAAAAAGFAYKNRTATKQPLSLSSFSAGFRFVWKAKVVLSAMALDMFGVLLGGATAMMPIYAQDILQVGPRGLGWLMAAPSIGAFSMALIQAHRGPLKKAGRTLLFAVAGFGTVTVIFGISKTFWLSMAMLFLLGSCDNISVVVRF